MMTIDTNANETAKLLRKFALKMDNLAPALEEIGEGWVSKIQLGFRGARDPWGNGWTALAASTVKNRRKNSSKPLNDTGILKSSFSSKVLGDKLIVGSNDERANTHQFGADRGAYGSKTITRKIKSGGRSKPYTIQIPWGDIPARRMLPIDASGRVQLPSPWVKVAEKAFLRHWEK